MGADRRCTRSTAPSSYLGVGLWVERVAHLDAALGTGGLRAQAVLAIAARAYSAFSAHVLRYRRGGIVGTAFVGLMIEGNETAMNHYLRANKTESRIVKRGGQRS